MAKTESGKLWQKANKDKVREYHNAYIKDKTHCSLILEPWVKEVIDRVKEPSQPYGNWARQFIEEWAKTQI